MKCHPQQENPIFICYLTETLDERNTPVSLYLAVYNSAVSFLNSNLKNYQYMVLNLVLLSRTTLKNVIDIQTNERVNLTYKRRGVL